MKKEISDFSTKELAGELWCKFFDNFIEKYLFESLFYLLSFTFIFFILKQLIESA